MEESVGYANVELALKQVRRNKGSSGVDGMTVDELPQYVAEHWEVLRMQLLAGTYQLKPVKRQEIEKEGGGVRVLGIPCVLDRFIQQCILQVLQPRFDPTFLRTQPRLPAWTGSAPSNTRGPALYSGRTAVGGGRRPGTIFRPGQP